MVISTIYWCFGSPGGSISDLWPQISDSEVRDQYPTPVLTPMDQHHPPINLEFPPSSVCRSLRPHSTSSIRKSQRERVRKWHICSKADSTNTRVRPKGRGPFPVVPGRPVRTSEDGSGLPSVQAPPDWIPALMGQRVRLTASAVCREFYECGCGNAAVPHREDSSSRRHGSPLREYSTSRFVWGQMTGQGWNVRKPKIPASTTAHEGITHVSIQSELPEAL